MTETKEENPSEIDKYLKKYLVVFLAAFYIIFSSFIQPFLHKSFVANHERDCLNIWDDFEAFDVKLQLTNTLEPTSSRQYKVLKTVENVKYHPNKFLVGDKILDFNYTLPLTQKIIENKTTLYFHALASPSRCQFVEFVPTNQPPCYTIQAFIPVIRWYQQKIDDKYNLLTEKMPKTLKNNLIKKSKNQKEIIKKSKSIIEENDKDDIEILPYEPFAFQNISFDIVHDTTIENPEILYSYNIQHYRFSIPSHIYLPPITADHFWDIDSHRVPLNFSAQSNFQNQSIDFNIKINLRHKWLWETKLDLDESENDEGGDFVHRQWEDLKRAMVDTSPILLYTTVIVSFAHVLLNLLAFKEDISWWNSRENLNAVSFQSVMIKAFSQLIVMLYIMDEDTSWVVRLMYFLGVLLEFWKITKILTPTMEFPYFEVKPAYRHSETLEFDMQGSKYLSYFLLPMLVLYIGYQIVFNKFRSFLSFIIRCAAGAVYAFGFLAMLPQLYVNYKLKTVAGMSGMVLAYKFVNTFIDDLFAFVLTMPLMHRIACFRDDIVFIAWLYQRHIYPTDPNRVNEFGEKTAENKDIKKKKVTDKDNDKEEEIKKDENNEDEDNDADLKDKKQENEDLVRRIKTTEEEEEDDDDDENRDKRENSSDANKIKKD